MRLFGGIRSVQRADHWPCKWCGVEICWDEHVKGENGRLVPLIYAPHDKSIHLKVHLCKSPLNPRNHKGALT